ncbi:MAG: efflux RND transporter permease subunit, partial [Luteimonas sp.]|nr:efflux RND transporter permease subunit [Luteimonas sp.]
MSQDGRFNLTAAALRHRELTLFFILVIAISGFASYFKLGQREDPDFTFRAMVVRTMWPGATAEQVDRQVTERIEKKLQEVPFFRHTRSYSKSGESLIILELHDTARGPAVTDAWYQVRKKLGDIRGTLPEGVVGPFYNDEFGDVFGSIYAFTADGFTHSDLRDYVDAARQRLLKLKNVAKVDLIGIQEDRIFIELSQLKLAALGLDAQQIGQALATQNIVAAAGAVNSATHTIPLRVTGELNSVAAVAGTRVAVAGRSLRIGDIARVYRDYIDPPISKMYYRGQQAIGLAVSMVKDGDVLKLGEDLDREMAAILAELPIGIEFAQVSNQPRIVKTAVGDFMRVFLEALAIVLVVSFLSLGLRTGLVVAITIPWVVAATFLGMRYFGIDLHRISTGALIIALGLLVDDAMIAVEMMIKKMEEGYDKFKAATFTYASTAFPMLTGTMVTIVGFVPVGFAQSGAGEYCFSLFAVIGIALIVSWIVAVLFTPLTGVFILPAKLKGHGGQAGHGGHGNTRFSRRFRGALDAALRRKWTVLGATAGLFVLALVGAQFVPQQFFPKSDRPEVMVDLTLPHGASLKATQEAAERVEKLLKYDPDVDYWSFYVCQGAIRFYLPLDQQLANDFFAQAVVVTKGHAVRERVIARLEKAFARDFDGLMARVTPLELGPPVGWPLKFRVSGPEAWKARELAHAFAQMLGKNPSTRNINYDWNESAKVIKVEVDQDRARLLGITSQQLSNNINAILSGTRVTQLRDHTYL